MATKAFVILDGDLDEELVPRYQQEESAGAFSIAGYARIEHWHLLDGMKGMWRWSVCCQKKYFGTRAMYENALTETVTAYVAVKEGQDGTRA